MKNIYTNLYTEPDVLGLNSQSPRLNQMLSLTKNLRLKNKKILDVGCYDGTFLTFFNKRTKQLYGLDGSPQSIVRTKKNKIKAKLYFFDDKTPMPYKDNSFDLIIAGEIIEHIYDTDFFLHEVERLLKPSGYFLLSTPNIASLGRRIFLLLGINPILEISPNYPDSCGHIRYFTRASLQQLVSHHHFKQITFISDIVNLSRNGKIYSKTLARLFPSLGQSLISLYKKTKY